MPNMKHKLFLLLLLIVASLVVVGIAYAQGEQPGYPTDNDINLIAKKLYCPVCPNTPLDVCETKACQDWRAQIRDQLSAGWTEQQVIDYFVAQYGERVLAEPQRIGFTSLVWFLPLVIVLIGLGVVYEVLRGWKRQKLAPASVTPTSSISKDVLEKIEREIRELD